MTKREGHRYRYRVMSLTKQIVGVVEKDPIMWRVSHLPIVVNPGQVYGSDSRTFIYDADGAVIESSWTRGVGERVGKYVPDQDFKCEGDYTDGRFFDESGRLTVICRGCGLFITDSAG